MTKATVDRLVARGGAILCVGPGGVGKTTVAALLGLHAAAAGRRTLCVTVDPSERLAESLGLRRYERDEDFDAPPREGSAGGGDPFEERLASVKERLDALVIHGAWVVDRAMAKYVPAEAHAEAMKGEFYPYLTRTLRGLHELAAMDLVADLAGSGRWDCIVIDTAPAAHALDFIEMPRRIVAAIRSPALAILMSAASAQLPGRRLLDKASEMFLRAVGRIAGMDFIHELSRFLLLSREGMENLCRAAEEMKGVAGSGGAAVVQVASAEAQAIDETIYLHGRIAAEGLSTSAFFVNRMIPCFDGPAGGGGGLPITGDAALDEKLRAVREEMRRAGAVEEKEVRRLLERTDPGIPVVTVPLVEEDVVDLPVLERLRGLMGPHEPCQGGTDGEA